LEKLSYHCPSTVNYKSAAQISYNPISLPEEAENAPIVCIYEVTMFHICSPELLLKTKQRLVNMMPIGKPMEVLIYLILQGIFD